MFLEKKIKALGIVIILSVLIYFSSMAFMGYYPHSRIYDKALDPGDFDVQSNLSLEEVETNDEMVESIFPRRYDKEYKSLGVTAMAVSEDGMIAVLMNALHNNYVISIYDENGNYLRGYEFNSFAVNYIYIEWVGDCINVLLGGGSNDLLSINVEEDSFALRYVPNNSSNEELLDDYHMRGLKEPSIEQGGYTYLRTRRIKLLGIISFTGNTVKRIDPDGNESILYSSMYPYLSYYFCVAVLIVVTSVLILVYYIKQKND